MAKKKMTKEVKSCSTSECGACKHCGWILPLVIIALIWFASMTTLVKVVITIVAALMGLGHLCPCKKQ